MTEEELNSVVGGFGDGEKKELPNHKKHKPVDDRDGNAERRCAFCGSEKIGFSLGGYGEGFGYKSAICKDCGGITDFVYKDEAEKFFPL